MSKPAIYELLHQEREIVIDPDAGHVVKREAWERIDWLLDCLGQLNRGKDIIDVSYVEVVGEG